MKTRRTDLEIYPGDILPIRREVRDIFWGAKMAPAPVVAKWKLTKTSVPVSTSFRYIIEASAAYFDVAAADILNPGRFKKIVYARNIVFFLSWEQGSGHRRRTLKRISNSFRCDPTTVFYGATKVRRLLTGGDAQLEADIEGVKRRLAARSEGK